MTCIEASPISNRRLALYAAAAALLAAAGPYPGSAQIVGTALDHADGTPVQGALIVLSDEIGTELVRTFTDQQGEFTVEPPVPGTYYVAAHALGYESLANVECRYAEGPHRVELALRRDPVAIEPIHVTTARIRRRLEAVGFYERERKGIGRFLRPEYIVDRTIDRVSDALRMEPSVIIRLVNDGSGSQHVVFRGTFRSLGAGCSPALILDGFKVGRDMSLDHLVHPNDVLAIELYPRGHGVPVQWSGFDAGCGVILIWTKRHEG